MKTVLIFIIYDHIIDLNIHCAAYITMIGIVKKHILHQYI